MARSIRDYTDSEKVNQLSWQAEVMFARLLLKADDFGSYHANPALLKSFLFPLRSATIRESDLSRWIAECESAGLIVVYNIAGKSYLRIKNYGQRLRNYKNRFPDPPPQLAATRGKSPPEEEVEEELELELELEEELEDNRGNFFSIDFIAENFKNSEWNYKICRDLEIDNVKNQAFQKEFLKEIGLKEKNYEYKTIREARSHYISWLKIKLKKENNSAKKEKYGASASNERVQRRNDVTNTLQKINGILGLGQVSDPGPNSTEDTNAIIIESVPKAGGGGSSGSSLQTDK